MIEKSDSISLALAMIAILGQAPSGVYAGANPLLQLMIGQTRYEHG